MRKFRKQIVFLFGCIALISYLSLHFSVKEEANVSVISTQKVGTHMQIYMKDDDSTLIPLSIPVDEESNEEEKIQMMFSYMSGKQKIKGFYPLFQKDCVLTDVKIEKGVVSLYLDESFLSYQEADELRVLEAITWGVTQFHDSEQVKLYMQKEAMHEMPVGKTPIPAILNRSIGINHFESAATNLHTSSSLTVFCTKKIQGIEYLVPRSKRVQLQGDSLHASVTSIISDISASSELSQPLYADHIEVKDFNMKDGVLSVELNKNILSSDKSVKQNVYDSLVLSFATIKGIEKVELKVDGNVVTPTNQKVQAVSKYELTYNKVEF